MDSKRRLTAALVIGTLAMSGALPARAHLSSASGPTAYPAFPAARGTGVTSTSVVVSPDLPAFPCGPTFSFPSPPVAFDAIGLWAVTQPSPDWDNDRYAPCFGDLYSAAEGATNAGVFAGAGINHKDTIPPLMPLDDAHIKFASTLPATVTASYTYSEPCYVLPGGSREALTGEAIGQIRVSGPAIGTQGTNTLVTSASVINKFWWSRVGLVALIGLDDTIVDLNIGAAPDPFRIRTSAGLGAAVFMPLTAPNCAAVVHTHPDDILIAAAGALLGTSFVE